MLQADLTEPLRFAADASFDLIVCILVLHYLKDWLPTLCEFHRVLRPGGRVIIATHHPFTDMDLSPTGNYFATDAIKDTGDAGKVRFYRRPLSQISRDLTAAHFVIEDIAEPGPLAPPDGMTLPWYDRVSTTPMRLLIRARREPGVAQPLKNPGS